MASKMAYGPFHVTPLWMHFGDTETEGWYCHFDAEFWPRRPQSPI